MRNWLLEVATKTLPSATVGGAYLPVVGSGDSQMFCSVSARNASSRPASDPSLSTPQTMPSLVPFAESDNMPAGMGQDAGVQSDARTGPTRVAAGSMPVAGWYVKRLM